MKEITLAHRLNPYFAELTKFGSTKELKRSALYRRLLPELEQVLSRFEVGRSSKESPAKPFYRAVAWNLERGICFEGILELLKSDPLLKEADIILAPETDLGMARSKNRNIARELAQKLGYHYFFGPCYLNLNKGSGIEADVEDENTLAIHGNAVFSRYPMKDFYLVPLQNNKDKMRGKEKRLGNQQALICTVELPDQDVHVVCVHLDAHSSKRHRRDQVRTILNHLKKLPSLPALFGGDFNTTTYNSRHAGFAIFGFWVRVVMGVRYVIRNHYPYPDRFFERPLFKSLECAGFNYKNFNAPGACTLHYHIEDLKKIRNLGDWIPNWCFRFIEWALKDNGGKCSFKLDWLAGKKIKAIPGSASVIGNLKYRGSEVSDHDPVVVEFEL